MSEKRKDYITWDEYFMGVAVLSSKRSKDPSTQVGACVASNDNKVVTMGYNGMPVGLSDDEMPWGRVGKDELDNKYLYVCHAEFNAILNSYAPVKGCKIYVTLFPCPMCASAINQSRIKKIVYGTIPYYAEKGTIDSILCDKNYGLPVEIMGGVLSESCTKILKEFFIEKRQ